MCPERRLHPMLYWLNPVYNLGHSQRPDSPQPLIAAQTVSTSGNDKAHHTLTQNL